jgi:hypothetical protein
MRFISPNIFQFKALSAGDNMNFVVNDSVIRFNSSPLVFSQTANATVTNTTTESSAFGTGAGTNSVTGSTLTVGTVVKMKGSGTIATGSGGRDVVIQFKFSNVQVGPSITGLAASTTVPYSYEVTFIPRALGTNQAVVVSYNIIIGNNNNTGASVTTMTTTGTLTGDLRVDWSAADVANIFTSYTNTLEVIRVY